MELSSQEPEIPIPLNSSYGGGGHGHMIHHHHHHPSSTTHNHIISSPTAPPQLPSSNNNNNNGSTNSSIPTALEVVDQHQHHVPFKKMVRYRECLKNHAASMGGNATDGCGEFMPSGEEGSIEALTCSACNCHRNFHRKEIEGEPQNSNSCNYHHMVRKVILGGGHHHKNATAILAPEAIGSLVPSRGSGPPHHQMIMSYNMGSIPSESDEQEDGTGGVRASHQIMKKRFRTKFTQEQKEKMLNFAEKVGWKIQKQEEAVVQQFCQEIGVKRRVLKVWMHNNKHNLAKKSSSTTTLPSSINNINTPPTTTAT